MSFPAPTAAPRGERRSLRTILPIRFRGRRPMPTIPDGALRHLTPDENGIVLVTVGRDGWIPAFTVDSHITSITIRATKEQT